MCIVTLCLVLLFWGQTMYVRIISIRAIFRKKKEKRNINKQFAKGFLSECFEKITYLAVSDKRVL